MNFLIHVFYQKLERLTIAKEMAKSLTRTIFKKKMLTLLFINVCFQSLESVTYTSNASGDWSSASTWLPVGGPPTAADTANIENGNTVSVTTNGDSANSLHIGGPITSGQLNITAGSLTNTSVDITPNFLTSSATISGGIWNTGSFTIGQSGTGNFTATGGTVNTSSASLGPNFFSDGTAHISNVGTNWILTNSITVASSGNGTFIVDTGASASCVGATIANTGSGIGQVTIDGTNSTWTNTGSLTIGANLTSGIFNVQNGGHSSATSTTLGHVAGGQGTFSLNGTAGAQGLFNTGFLIGGPGTSTINFNGGILQASGNNSNFISTITNANVQAGGAYFDSQNFNITIPQVLTGSGTLFKQGTGTVILTGANTYSGGTTITAGTLQGDTNSIPNGNIVDEGTLIFNQTFDGTFAGSISGAGAFIKQGGNQLQLTGDSSGFTGTSTIAFGNLNVNGILGGALTVNSGAILSGNGTLGNVTNNGTISPGNSIGTLHMMNFVNNSTGIYQAEINAAGASDEIVASETATLNGGELVVTADQGIYLKGTTYTLIDAAGGLTGQFATTILPTNVLLGATYLPTQLILTVLATTLDTSGLHGNALRVANYIKNHVDADTDILKVIAALNSLDPQQEQKALDQLHPAIFEALALTAGDTAQMINATFTNRLEYLRNTCFCENSCSPCACGEGAWIAGTADFIRQDKIQGLRRFNTSSEGVSLGYDTRILESWLTGLGLGYAHTNLHWGNSAGRANVNSFYVGAYTTQCNDCYYIDAALLGFTNNYRVHRHIHFADIDRTAKNKHYGWGLNPHLAGGVYLNYCAVDITPFVELDYYFVQQNKVKEHGADSLDLHVKSNQSDLLRVETGVNFSKSYNFCGGSLKPNVSISYVGHRLLSGKKYTSSLKGIDADFAVFGTGQSINQLELGGGLLYVINDYLAVNAWYDIELGHKRQEQEVNLEINYRF